MSQVHVRKIQAEDAESFRECLNGVARERKYLAQVEAPPMEMMRQFVNESVAKDVAQYVAVHDGRVVGWCDVFPHWAYALQHVGTLGIGVASSFRGKGLGRMLKEKTLDHACAKGIYRVTLEAREDNVRAIRLYESVGFKHEGRSPCALRFDGVFYTGVIMAKLQGAASAA